MSITLVMSADGILAVTASNWTVANAVWPSLALISADTEVTEGSGRTPPSAWSTRAITSGASIAREEWKTT
ncbi:MAG: hypothetical protein ABSA91_03345 [Acidimicrobiales bacterium]